MGVSGCRERLERRDVLSGCERKTNVREDSELSATEKSGRPRARCVSGKGSVVRSRDQVTA